MHVNINPADEYPKWLEYLVLRQAVVVVPEVYENGVALRRRY
jgi:hypothetical protein